jgi:hypothetical protein
LDAFVPENDQCLFDFQPDDLRAQRQQEAAAQNGGLTPIPAESFHVNPGDVDWVNSKTVLQPLHTMDQPVRLTGGLWSAFAVNGYSFWPPDTLKGLSDLFMKG